MEMYTVRFYIFVRFMSKFLFFELFKKYRDKFKNLKILYYSGNLLNKNFISDYLITK